MTSSSTNTTQTLEWTSLTIAEQDMVRLLRRLPEPVSTAEATRLETELADRFEIAHAVVLSSGTAALHCALIAAGIGPGDEVLVPTISVAMSVAPILYVGARPVFIDCAADGSGVDHDDLAAKITPRSRAVVTVHLWGRAGGDPGRLTAEAARHGLLVIEDACQAHGTRYDGRLLGTIGDIGCLSLRDGKILSAGEGGVLLTDDDGVAGVCRALRTHWQTPPPGSPPGSRLGYNYRLAEPLALLARSNLARFDDLLLLRRRQSSLLTSLVERTSGLSVLQSGPREDWNAYSPLLRVELPRPRQFCQHLAELGVPNSVGTFGLIPCHRRRPFADTDSPADCPNAERIVYSTLAVVLGERDTDERITGYGQTIVEEAARWARI
jgi:dTDP-4-amino-4,6-dideoxygalactose transaminase